MTLFLFIELSKLSKLEDHTITLSNLQNVIATLDIENISKSLLNLNYGRIVKVHDTVPVNDFITEMQESREVRIMQLSVPNLGDFDEASCQPIDNGGMIKILLLHPDSVVSGMQSHDLQVPSNKSKTSSEYVKN